MPTLTWRTYGQWRQMNITRSASASATSASFTVSPVTTSVRAKSGASVPNGSICDSTAMRRAYRPSDEPDVGAGRVRRDEPQETFGLFDDRVPIISRDALEGLDLERDAPAFTRRSPQGSRVPVDQDETPVPAREHAVPMIVGEDPGSVG